MTLVTVALTSFSEGKSCTVIVCEVVLRDEVWGVGVDILHCLSEFVCRAILCRMRVPMSSCFFLMGGNCISPEAVGIF